MKDADVLQQEGGQLVNGLIDMLQANRLTETDIPDDYEWLVRQTAKADSTEAFYVHGIDWDTDGETVGHLPEDTVIFCSDEEQVNDALSDEHGFLIYGVDAITRLS